MEQVGENIYDGPERGVYKTDAVPAGNEMWYRNGKLHRDHGPAFINHKANTETWYQDGKLHRDHGPALINNKAGTEKWYRDNKLHRVGGPAITYSDGTERWYQDGKRHRVGGPAIKHPDGSEEWWLDGKRHRDYDAAKIYPDGKEYWVEGKKLTEEQFLRYKKMKMKSDRQKKFPAWHGLKEWGLRPLATGELKRHFDEMQEYGIIDPDEEFDEETMRTLTTRSLRQEEVDREIFEDIEEDDAGVYDGPERGVKNRFGHEKWYLDGKLHRDYGPARIDPDGSEFWYQHDEPHRIGAPAVKKSVNSVSQYVNGKFYMTGSEYWYENGELHRIDGPARIDSDGSEYWYQHGEPHRIGGPAIIDPDDGTEEWYENGKLHRVGGPAKIYADGTEYWYENGKYNRIGGPAIIETDGTEEWYKDGELHNDVGPAFISSTGKKQYWIEGKKLTEDQFLRYKKMYEKSERRKISPEWHGLKEWGLRPLASGELKRHFDEMQEYGIIDPDEEFDEESMRKLTASHLRKEEIEREIFEVDDAGVYDEIVMVIDKKSGKVTYEKVSSLVQ